MAITKNNNPNPKKPSMSGPEVDNLVRMRAAHHHLNCFVWFAIGGKANLKRFQKLEKPTHVLPLTKAFDDINKNLKCLGQNPLTSEEESQVVNVVFRTGFQIEKSEKERAYITLRGAEIVNYNTSTVQYTTPSAPETNNYTFLSVSKTQDQFDRALALFDDEDDL